MTSIYVRKKDRDYLVRLRDKKKKRGIGAIVESIIKLIKFHKMEEELE